MVRSAQSQVRAPHHRSHALVLHRRQQVQVSRGRCCCMKDSMCGCHMFVHWCKRSDRGTGRGKRWWNTFHDLSGERGALHGGDVSRPVEGNVQMIQLPSMSVGEVQRLVPSSRLQAFEVVARDLRWLSYQRSVSTCQQSRRVIIHLRNKEHNKKAALECQAVAWAKRLRSIPRIWQASVSNRQSNCHRHVSLAWRPDQCGLQRHL